MSPKMRDQIVVLSLAFISLHFAHLNPADLKYRHGVLRYFFRSLP